MVTIISIRISILYSLIPNTHKIIFLVIFSTPCLNNSEALETIFMMWYEHPYGMISKELWATYLLNFMIAILTFGTAFIVINWARTSMMLGT